MRLHIFSIETKTDINFYNSDITITDFNKEKKLLSIIIKDHGSLLIKVKDDFDYKNFSDFLYEKKETYYFLETLEYTRRYNE